MSEATLSPPCRTERKLVFFPTNISSQNNFGLLRLFLAILVVFSHSFAISKTGSKDPFAGIAHGQMDLGALAVNGFFSISGFLIASSWLQTGNFRAYLRKRVLRIAPGFVTSVLLCIFVVGPLAGVNLASYFHNPDTYRFGQILLMQDVFMKSDLPGVFKTNPMPSVVDGSLWTIRYEVLCYLLLPLLAVCGLLRRRVLLLALFAGLLLAYHHSACGFGVPAFKQPGLPWDAASLYFLPRLVIFFLAGTTFYAWRNSIPRSPLLLLVCLAVLVATRGHDTFSSRWNLFMPICCTYAVFYAAYAKTVLPRLSRLAQKHDLSYGMYLYGFPVEQLLAHAAQVGHIAILQSAAGLFVSATSITLVLAALSWRYIEHPFLKMKVVRRSQPVSETEVPAPARDIPVLVGTA